MENSRKNLLMRNFSRDDLCLRAAWHKPLMLKGGAEMRMKMQTIHFRESYKDLSVNIDENSPEIRFMRCIGGGGCDAADYFYPVTVYRDTVFLDAPNGRFTGLAEIGRFAAGWLKDFEASKAEVYPVIQTKAGGRSVTEMEVWFHLEEGGIKRVPMTVFADLAAGGKMEGMRIYYFFKFLPGAVAYRPPVFRPGVKKPTEPVLMTGVMRYYYEQLHNFRTGEALENIMDMLTQDCRYGGYRPEEDEPLAVGKEAIRVHYEDICQNVPAKNYIRFETIVDDGMRMAAEWTSVVTREGRKDGRMTFCGCAVYDRDEKETGKLGSIRINDNAGYDFGIDRNAIPEWDNFVDD